MRAAALAALVALVTIAVASDAAANKKPWLGVLIANNCPAQLRHAACRDGVRIDQIFPDTPAARARLARGDVVVKVSGVAVRLANELIHEITTRHKVGDVAELEVVRGNRVLELQVTLDARMTESEMFSRAHVGETPGDLWRPITQVKGERLSPSISSHRGDVVVVYLFATSCKVCPAITRTLESLHAALGRRGLVVLAASEESADTLARLRTRLPVFADSGSVIRRSFSSPRGDLPLVAVVGRDGVITHAALGDGVDAAELKAAVERAVRITAARAGR